MLIALGNLSAWQAESGLIFLAQDLSQYHWRSMHDCTHVHHVQLHCYLVPLRKYNHQPSSQLSCTIIKTSIQP